MQMRLGVTLRDVCSDVLVVAHNEDTSELVSTFRAEGFAVREVRGPYPSETAGWSPNTLCLVNHTNAWRIASTKRLSTIIIEADFVPVQGFGKLPFPSGGENGQDALYYLYACGPQVWDFIGGGLRGHAGSTVAYVVSPALAKELLVFAQTEVFSRNPREYSGWDTGMGYWLNKRGIESYMPYRHYGEHGGQPNPEHNHAGLRPHHRADVLFGQLAFLPTYAEGSSLRLAAIRTRARLWGLARLAGGRFMSLHDIWRVRNKAKLFRVILGRQFLRTIPELDRTEEDASAC
jgi:hypothetical protein